MNDAKQSPFEIPTDDYRVIGGYKSLLQILWTPGITRDPMAYTSYRDSGIMTECRCWENSNNEVLTYN